MPNYQDCHCHIFQRDKSQTSGADKVPAQRIQTSGPQLSLGAESSTAPTGGRSTSGTARRTPSRALAERGKQIRGDSPGGQFLVGQSWWSVVGHLWWAKSGGPIRSKPGGPTGGPIGGPFAVGQNWWADREPSLVVHPEQQGGEVQRAN